MHIVINQPAIASRTKTGRSDVESTSRGPVQMPACAERRHAPVRGPEARQLLGELNDGLILAVAELDFAAGVNLCRQTWGAAGFQAVVPQQRPAVLLVAAR